MISLQQKEKRRQCWGHCNENRKTTKLNTVVATGLFLLFALLLPSNNVVVVHGLAASKSKNKKKAGGGGVGFGAKKQAPVGQHVPDDSETTAELFGFLERFGAGGLDRVEIGTDPATGIRGLYAKKAIKKDQPICRVPSNCALALADPNDEDSAKASFAENGLFFLRQYIENTEARTFWSPYLDTLPTQEESLSSPNHHPTPDHYNEEQIQMLEFPRMIETVHQRQNEIQSLLSAQESIDEEQLKWATWLASTRSFELLEDEEEDEEDNNKIGEYDERGQKIVSGSGPEREEDEKYLRVLCPLLDMVNHASTNFNARFRIIDPEKDDAWFALEASRNIPAGKQICLLYGSGVYSSVEFLSNYGFLPQANNPVDKSMLKKEGAPATWTWTTSAEEDRAMMDEIVGKEKEGNDKEEDRITKQILRFRMNLKQASSDE